MGNKDNRKKSNNKSVGKKFGKFLKQKIFKNFLYNVTVNNGDFVLGNKNVKFTGETHFGNFTINFNYTGIIIIVIFGFILISNMIQTNSMNGDLNIAVIPLVDDNLLNGNDIKDGKIISEYIYRKIPANLNGEFEFDKIIDKNIFLNLSSREKVEKYVERYANKVNAQVVIYGYIDRTEYSDLHIELKMYISPRNFYDVDELLGYLTLGDFIIDQKNLSGIDVIGQNQSFRNQLEIIAYIVKAFGSFIDEDFENAIENINEALEERLWVDNNGLELLYLIKGNIIFSEGAYYLDNGDFIAAREKIQDAKNNYEISASYTEEKYNQIYSRAYLGLAGIASCNAIIDYLEFGDTQLIDQNQLIKAEEYLNIANLQNNLPYSADIVEKSSYIRAQLKLSEYLLTLDDNLLEQSRKNYLIVINSYEDGNERIIDIAAKSYAGVATALSIEEPEKFESIVVNYKSAIKLTENPRFKAITFIKLGKYYFDIGKHEEAIEAFENAKNYDSHLSPERVNYINSILDTIRGYDNESE